ncbi:MAG: hypothetical protein ACTSQE_01945 [Candidatus Heimdallarchaeaceae archaeon]
MMFIYPIIESLPISDYGLGGIIILLTFFYFPSIIIVLYTIIIMKFVKNNEHSTVIQGISGYKYSTEDTKSLKLPLKEVLNQIMDLTSYAGFNISENVNLTNKDLSKYKIGISDIFSEGVQSLSLVITFVSIIMSIFQLNMQDIPKWQSRFNLFISIASFFVCLFITIIINVRLAKYKQYLIPSTKDECPKLIQLMMYNLYPKDLISFSRRNQEFSLEVSIIETNYVKAYSNKPTSNEIRDTISTIPGYHLITKFVVIIVLYDLVTIIIGIISGNNYINSLNSFLNSQILLLLVVLALGFPYLLVYISLSTGKGFISIKGFRNNYMFIGSSEKMNNIKNVLIERNDDLKH